MTLVSSGKNQSLGRVKIRDTLGISTKSLRWKSTFEELKEAHCNQGLVGGRKIGRHVTGRAGEDQTMKGLVGHAKSFGLVLFCFFNGRSVATYWRVLRYLISLCLSVLICKMVL